jgi:hypothetical protein
MARLPALGESPWKDIMDGFLTTYVFNTDGTLKSNPAQSIIIGTATGSTIAVNALSAATSAPAVVGQATAYYAGLFYNVTDAGSDLANANMIGLVGQSVYSNAGYFQQGAVGGGAGSTLARNSAYPALYVTRVTDSLGGFNFTQPLLRVDDTTSSSGGLIDVKRGGATVFAMANNGTIVATATAGTGLTIDRGIKLNAAVSSTVAGPSFAVSSNILRIIGGTNGVIFGSQDNGTQTGRIDNAGFTSLSIGTLSTSTFVAFPAGTTAASSLRLPHGSAPTSPVDGDMWTTTSGLFIRINGVTVGPLS